MEELNRNVKTRLSVRKRFAAIASVVLALAITLGGTYAWQSMSEAARINALGESGSAGGRLHDDFQAVGRSDWGDNFTANKDIYVENYETIANDGDDIFVRLKLYEYMEVGVGATLSPGDTGYSGRAAAEVVSETDRDDVSTWTPRIPGPDPAGSDLFRAVWDWDMGGQKTYMPTFNKNNHSEETDVKGAAVDLGILDTAGGEQLNATKTGEGNAYPVSAGLHDYFATNTTHDAVEKTYDAAGSLHLIGTIGTDEVQHTAKDTEDAMVMTMADWKAAGSLPGDYWVLDADGWCYWANPIAPESATGLLISGITLRDEPEGEWYYGVYVKSEMASGNDWKSTATGQGFYATEAPSADAEDLMYIVTGHTPLATGVTMSETMTATTVGTPITLTATVAADYTHDPSYQAVTWTIDPMSAGTLGGGVFTPAAGDAGKWFTIKATSDKNPSLYGECKVYVPAVNQGVVKGQDGSIYAYYVNNDDNTYQKVMADGMLGAPVCPVVHGQPGEVTDRTAVVEVYGARYLFDTGDYYYAKGPDGLLGLGGDDVLCYDNGSTLVRTSIRLGITTYADSNGVVWRILKDNRMANGTQTRFVTESGGAEISDGSGTVLLITDKVYGTGNLESYDAGYYYNYNATDTTNTPWMKYEEAPSIKAEFDEWYSANVSAILQAVALIPNLTYESNVAPDPSWSDIYNLDTAISTPGNATGGVTSGVAFPLSVSEVNRYIGTTNAIRQGFDIVGIAQSWWLRSSGRNTVAYGGCVGGGGNPYGFFTVGNEKLGLRPAIWIDTTP